MTDRYGLPYMGSKSQIARWVVESLHGGANHYDDKIEGLYVPKEQACDLVDYVQVKLF